jgi:hypothetical protein
MGALAILMDGLFSIGAVLSGSVGSTEGSLVGSSELVADTDAEGWLAAPSVPPPPHAVSTASVPIAKIRRHPGMAISPCMSVKRRH